jgi:hypothetical protein
MVGAGRFIDSYGFGWSVAELPEQARPRAQSRSDSAGSLYFFSGVSTYVLREYPGQWQELSWPELESLLARSACLKRDVTRPDARRGVALSPAGHAQRRHCRRATAP